MNLNIFSRGTEHYQLFDCNYIAQILKKYQKWSRSKKIELNISNEIAMQEKKIDESEQFEIMSNAINEKYNYFLQNGSIEEPVIHIFSELIERKIIKMPTKETPKLSIYYDNKLLQAKEELIKEFEATTEPDKFKRKEIKSILSFVIIDISFPENQEEINNIVNLLVRYGANVNYQNRNGDTPLHFMIFTYSFSVINNIIEAGANVTIMNNQNETPLDTALSEGRLIDSRIISILH